VKALITGASGQLARAFTRRLQQDGIPHAAPPETELDITAPDDVTQQLDDLGPDVILNCAACNAVDAIERDDRVALAVNRDAVATLAAEAASRGILLVHFSTDYVFDGAAGRCYTETDRPAPLNAYGRSKLLGEQAAAQAGCDLLLLRTSWVYGDGTQNFFHKLLQWARQRTELEVVNDEISVPTFTQDIVSATLDAIDTGLRGLYHLTNTGYASRYEAARLYLELLGRETPIRPVPSSRFPSPIKRPAFSALNNSRLTAALAHPIPTWQDAMARFAAERLPPSSS